MQKVSDAPLTVCENCGGELEKQWSRSGFQFKGSGWYVTDYSNKGKAEKSSETKSETPAAAPEKSSAGESTVTPSAASNTVKNDGSASKKE